MKKRVILAIAGLIVLIAILGAVKALQIGAMIDQGKKFVPPPETVSTAMVTAESWETALTSVGTLTAVQGVTVAAEQPGKVVQIAFEPGAPVTKGTLLIRQDTSSEEAQLPGALAEAKLARINQQRTDQLLKDGVISQADHDRAVATTNQTQAQVDTIRAAIAKKTVRAPFTGRLGIRQVNLGQILKEGDPIVTLQSLDPIYVDFTLPQQQLPKLHRGFPVRVATDALPGETIEGRITAINPQVDADTRNIKVQATVANHAEKLRPGMFVTVAVGLPVQQKVLAIPATAVLYAPYSDSVFVVEEGKEKKGKVLRQQFVRLGSKRGDFIAVISGLREGEAVVSTGVFKLRNGQGAVVDNRLAPPFQQAPKPENN
ncbi:efflux RND transporter periplasmic adaptor subunit [Geobacter pickeringii]|uniref:RND transporter n=1 Tax=Geobacter pickeringii TaxID=345632 RepID=A0A0B5B7S7_9BACT|nr:efflux RND transporter periplasmic adaptor subunit [Geobacter pickeringii]AJE02583.1 RND transporter [Geobacter pickeringii]